MKLDSLKPEKARGGRRVEGEGEEDRTKGKRKEGEVGVEIFPAFTSTLGDCGGDLVPFCVASNEINW
ncbi:hypothetical protein KFK09_005667 [Dendrobium nobile]|uniref:Uncharacterized protein n=1 Tax=Dendrobium nobile TaxID=94219 RepID=A0A8T3BYX6_DENNO|nr:hypothetical protein KFK09_005667 [Dendrobium nobile]